MSTCQPQLDPSARKACFIDLGSSTFGSGGFETTRFKNRATIGRVKLNYKF